MNEDISTQAIPAYAKIAEALAGKTFPANYVYGIGAASSNASGVNDDIIYSGQVAGFTAKAEGGVFTIIDSVKGIVSFGGVNYQIMGPSTDGQSVVLGITKTETFGGSSFTTTSPALLVSNSGTAPAGSVNFNTNNPYTTPTPVCFAAGTLIETANGPIAIELLSVGDELMTSAGTSKVVWTGSMRLRCADTPWEASVAPVRISANAIAEAVPSRDLVVSPGHGIGFDLLGPVLVPAGVLVNGTTVMAEAPEWIDYWHVEVEGHAMIKAEGLSCESYLDVGNRGSFEIAQLDQSDTILDPSDVQGSFPRLSEGALVEAIKERLHERALSLGWQRQAVTEAPCLMVDGNRVTGLDKGEAVRFVIAADASEIAIAARTFIPALLDPRVRDSRELGVKVLAIEATDGFQTNILRADHDDLQNGFHGIEFEPMPARWTGSTATVPRSILNGLEGDVYLTLRLVDRARETVELVNNSNVRKAA